MDEPYPNPNFPENISINEQTKSDVARAFDYLDSSGILAEDAQFMITKSGRAKLIDHGAFKDAKSFDSAKLYNQKWRNAYLEAIDTALAK